jgi:hypothetical protein
MSAECENPKTMPNRWPFDPMRPEDHDSAHLPGGTATVEKKKEEAKPKPRAKPVDPPPRAT